MSQDKKSLGALQAAYRACKPGSADEKLHLDLMLAAVIERVVERRGYNRETTWTTHLGVKVKVRDMEDSHVVNLVRFLEHYETHPASRGMLPVMRDEMRIRGLKIPPFQIPYHDGEGNLIIWDFKTRGPKIVGVYKPTYWARFKLFITKAWNYTLEGCRNMHDWD